MTAAMPLNLPEPVSAQVHQARWVVGKLWGFVEEWIPSAARPFVEDRVEQLAQQILAVAPPADPIRVGAAVFQRVPVFNDRLYRQGLRYEPASAVFEELPTSALEYCEANKTGDFVICWLTEQR